MRGEQACLMHGDDVHHVDVKHLEVIQDLQTIHVPIIE